MVKTVILGRIAKNTRWFTPSANHIDMKKLVFALLFSVSFLLTGCIDIVEELTLNKSGKGLYSLTIDMSSILQLGSLKDLMNQAGADESTAKLGLDKLEKDTIIYLKDMPADLKAQTGNPAFWDKAQVNLKMSEKDKKFLMQMRLNFDKIEDIEFFYKNLGTVMKEGAGELGGGMPMEGLTPTGVAFKLAKKSLTRMPTPKPENQPTSEDLDMMKMFLGSAKYTTIYNLPNRVKKAKMANAKIDGNTVTVENSMLDIMEGKAKLDGQISY